MKVILYMAITPNGLIAKSNDDTNWISHKEWNSYSLATREAGNLIIGHRTYNTLTKQPEFSEFKDIKIVVVATQPVNLETEKHSVAASPKAALDLFASEDKIIVAGGGSLNASFLKENLIDEIYLDIEPIIFGKGIQIFHDKDFECKLKFIDLKNISDNEIQLHYQVLK